MIDVCLLGCGGSMPMPYRALSASLINYKGRKILIDCGEGTQVSMKQVGWGFKAIDIICLTHGHGDHIIGLPGLLSTMGNSGRIDPLTIIGPVGITRIVNGLRVVAEFLPYEIKIIEAPELIEFLVSKEGIIDINDFKGNKIHRGELMINTIQCEHSSPCIGFSFNFKRNRKFSVEKAEKNKVPKLLWSRLQKEEIVDYEGNIYNSELVLGEERQGIKISLITDTRPLASMPSFIKSSDLFICEGTYGDDNDREKAIKYKHMTFREAAVLAKAGEVGQLLLTHFSPSMMEPKVYLANAIEVFQNTAIGEDRIIKNLSFID